MRRTTHVVEDVAEADSILDTGREHLEVVPIMVVSLLLCHLHFLWLQTHPVFTTQKRLPTWSVLIVKTEPHCEQSS